MVAHHIEQLAQLAQKYKAHLIIDEAHALQAFLGTKVKDWSKV